MSLVSVHKWLFSAISASIGGITCAAYRSTPPRNAADFLELAENCSFLDRNLISTLNETVDGHEPMKDAHDAAGTVREIDDRSTPSLPRLFSD